MKFPSNAMTGIKPLFKSMRYKKKGWRHKLISWRTRSFAAMLVECKEPLQQAPASAQIHAHFQVPAQDSELFCSAMYFSSMTFLLWLRSPFTNQICPFSVTGLSSSSTDSSFGSWKSLISKLAPASLRAFPGFLVVRPTTGMPAATPARIPDAESLTKPTK